MTSIASKFNPTYYFASFGEALAPHQKDLNGTAGLQIYSPIPLTKLCSTDIGHLDIAVWEGEGYALHGNHLAQDDGIVTGRFWGWWSGLGTHIPFPEQYFPFTRIAHDPPVFQAISLHDDGKKYIQQVEFVNAGVEAVLRSWNADRPDEKHELRFRLQETRVPRLTG